MTKEQLQILQHTVGCDEFGRRRVDRNHFVTDAAGKDGLVCESLVALGFMKRHEPTAISGGMHIYRVQARGFTAMRKNSPAPPPVPKQTNGQKRYAAYQEEDSGLTFHEWLLVQKYRKQQAVR